MYAMMLPSGNDAAQSLALYFGAYIYKEGKIDPNQFLHVVKQEVIDQRVNEMVEK
jgi:hypothetical protein